MGAPSRLEPEALTSAPDGDDVCLDLVLDREDLDALRIFHKSFNLPGLRFGLLNPICSDDYYPEDETAVPAVDREPWISQLPAQTESLITRANALLLGEEVPEEEEVVYQKKPRKKRRVVVVQESSESEEESEVKLPKQKNKPQVAEVDAAYQRTYNRMFEL